MTRNHPGPPVGAFSEHSGAIAPFVGEYGACSLVCGGGHERYGSVYAVVVSNGGAGFICVTVVAISGLGNFVACAPVEVVASRESAALLA